MVTQEEVNAAAAAVAAEGLGALEEIGGGTQELATGPARCKSHVLEVQLPGGKAR